MSLGHRSRAAVLTKGRAPPHARMLHRKCRKPRPRAQALADSAPRSSSPAAIPAGYLYDRCVRAPVHLHDRRRRLDQRPQLGAWRLDDQGPVRMPSCGRRAWPPDESPRLRCRSVTTPADFIAHLRKFDGFTVSEPVPVTVDGVSGSQVDVLSNDVAADGMFLLPEDGFNLGPGEKTRFLVLDKDGATVILFIESVRKGRDLRRLHGRCRAAAPGRPHLGVVRRREPTPSGRSGRSS